MAALVASVSQQLIYVLLGSGVVTAALCHRVDSLVILGVVVDNAAIGFMQEGKAEEAMDAIRQTLAPQASVRRDGIRLGIALFCLIELEKRVRLSLRPAPLK